MKLPRIYQNLNLTLHHVQLDENAARHLITVLRLQKNDQFILFNNDGFDYTAQIDWIKKNTVQASILSRVEKNLESPLILHLGQAISKGERMDLVIQKATELGVHAITPLISERCVVHLKGERVEKKIEHWQKIAIHAAEQCGRTHVPLVHPILKFPEWVFNTQEQTKLILHVNAPTNIQSTALSQSIALLIGPEGGFTQEEVDLAKHHQFQTLQMGPRILRTETAAIAALSILQFKAGDMG